MQEKVHENWDKYINLFSQAHNQSTSIYGYSPEVLMFAYRKPNANDLLQFWPNTPSHEEYVKKIFPEIERKREEAKARADSNKDRLRNYKNLARVEKEFSVGQIVACRQLQVTTGPNSGLKPQYTGPYAVIALNADKCSCMIENLDNGHQSKEHFTNLIPINFHPDYNRVQSNFDDEIKDMIENLKRNKLRIKPSTRRILKVPSSIFGSDNEDDDDDDDNIDQARPGPSNQARRQIEEDLDDDDDDDDPDLSDTSSDAEVDRDWQQAIDEHLADIDHLEGEIEVADDGDETDVEDDPRALSQASQADDDEANDDDEDADQTRFENLLVCQIKEVRHLFKRRYQ